MKKAKRSDLSKKCNMPIFNSFDQRKFKEKMVVAVIYHKLRETDK